MRPFFIGVFQRDSLPPLTAPKIAYILLPDGRIGLTLAHPWADGTRALVFGGVEFLEKLAVLIPKPRINLLIYHGILGARARRRRAARAAPAPATPPLPDAPTSGSPPPGAGPPSRRARRWADLMRRVFAIDVLVCECGGRLRFLATIEDPLVVRRILRHLGLPTDTALPDPARRGPYCAPSSGTGRISRPRATADKEALRQPARQERGAVRLAWDEFLRYDLIAPA